MTTFLIMRVKYSGGYRVVAKTYKGVKSLGEDESGT